MLQHEKQSKQCSGHQRSNVSFTTADNTQSKMLNRCIRLVREDGQYSKAVQALSSVGIAPPGPATTATLKDKHPEGPDISFWYEQLPTFSSSAFVSTELEVLTALYSFPKGTACGRSGLRVSCLLNMHSALTTDMLKALTEVINKLLKRQAPIELAQYLSSAPLTPLLKKDGGFLPIAI